MSVAADGPCPCGRVDARQRPLAFARCCGPCLADFAQRPAPDAEALMRSRYCAFVLEDADHLMATWYWSKRPPDVQFEAGTKWLGLEVREHRVIDDGHAEVEFVARSRQAGRAHRLHERSRFVREDGRWYYVDGEMK
jgi:SEC-C motif domain protein